MRWERFAGHQTWVMAEIVETTLDHLGVDDQPVQIGTRGLSAIGSARQRDPKVFVSCAHVVLRVTSADVGTNSFASAGLSTLVLADGRDAQ